MKQLLIHYSYGGILNALEGECCIITDQGPCVNDLQNGGVYLPGMIHGSDKSCKRNEFILVPGLCV